MNFLKSKKVDPTPLLAEIEDLKGKNETLKSLLRTAEEALRQETDLRKNYQALFTQSEKELNAIAKFTDLTER